MPKCVVCGDMLPPDVCYLVDANVRKCLFCEYGKEDLCIDGRMVNKEFEKKDYEIYLKKLNEKAKEKGIKNAANELIKE